MEGLMCILNYSNTLRAFQNKMPLGERSELMTSGMHNRQ